MDRAADLTVEHAYQCPHCWAPISAIVDLSVPHQIYIEDCEVCCQPIEIECSASERGVETFDARPMD